MVFVVEFLRAPRRTGALTPSSPWSIRALLDEAEVTRARHVVELGAGTGAITKALLERMPPDANLISMEVNPVFFARLERRFAADRVTVVSDSAEDLPQVLAEQGFDTVDRVVSALPWTTMPHSEQERIVTAIAKVLGDGGRFSTLMCRHRAASAGARRFERLLHSHFGTVRRGRTVWAEIPPMFAYHCSLSARPD
ncbi:class I SAM-dependent methyltransferase [Allorhizocola rhizosphaerae]|uniref:class I SAM-dependent methyltransferase n=1 Tax=Allorhizocola rhizosphaerae TaxID=1872709 RepID=UPI000E3C927F|nr:methyltransferase domain-containing protein [Allorhizocola rhizosphaerae]